MAVVAITGGPGAPGATSAGLALLLGWPLTDRRRVLLLEADPDGGAVLAGAFQGEIQADKGLRNLSLSDRRGRLMEEMWDQCIDISPHGTGDRLLLPGLTDPAQAQALVYTWEPLAEACQALDAYGCDVIVDLGRSGAHGPSGVLARRADVVVAVLRTTLRGLSTARPRVGALSAELRRNGAAEALALLLIREGPYAAPEVTRELGAPVVGILPFAPKEARILSDGGGRTTDRRFQRSELMRAARSAGDELRALTARRRLVTLPAPGPLPASGPAPAPAPTAVPVPGSATAPAPAGPFAPAIPGPTPPQLPLHAVASAPASLAPTADATRLGYREAQSPQLTQQPPTVPLVRPWSPPATATWSAPEVGYPAAPAPAPGWPGGAGPDRPHAPAASHGAAVVPPWPESGGGDPAAPGYPGYPGCVAEPVQGGGVAAGPWPVPSAQQPEAPGGEGGRPWPGQGGVAQDGSRSGEAVGAAGTMSMREMMDLAAAAELRAEEPQSGGPTQTAMGPLTPGQAARLQAVHTERPRTPALRVDRSAFTPPHMVVMPPLAEHAPRPPAPEEIRPADEGPESGGEGVAGVR